MDEHIPVIVLTGGSCAGKTTILSGMQQKLTDMGYAVLTVSEAATEFILSGLKPDPAVFSWLDFQRQLLRYIIEKENRWAEAARLLVAEKKVILCDRGVMDVAAYVSSSEFDEMLIQEKTHLVAMRDQRYDAIIFLRSLAFDAPHLYSCANNPARAEKTVEKAREIDARTLDAWIGHSHVRVIDNSTDLEGKSRRTLAAICQVLGIPVPIEIERKYLVAPGYTLDPAVPIQHIHIMQQYLRPDPDALDTIERIRARGQGTGYVYYHTFKQALRPGVRIEREEQIMPEKYAELQKRADPGFGLIDKIRHCFVWRNQYFELDTFRNPAGLTLLEIEQTEETDTIVLPDYLEPYLTDVTDNPHYSNYEIARRLATS